jgi:hypothetical protein
MTRRKWFNVATGVSLVLFVLTCFAWYRVMQTPRVTEADRLEWKRNEINAAVARAIANGPLGRGAFETPEYQAQEERRKEWEQTYADYQRREPAILAAEYRRYVLCPLAILTTLAALPLIFVFQTWRRFERRLAARAISPPTLLQSVYRRAFATLTVICAAGALLATGIWPRSNSTSDLFFYSAFFDRDDLTFWRVTMITIGRGGVGIHQAWRSGPKATFRNLTEQTYIRINQSLATAPFHHTLPARYPDFNSGRPQWDRGGIKWVYYNRDDPTQPPSYSYELVAPLWTVATALSIVPLFWFWRWNIRRKRVRAGCCTRCGYDLTGNASGVCPECGAGVRSDAVASQIA